MTLDPLYSYWYRECGCVTRRPVHSHKWEILTHCKHVKKHRWER